MSTQGRLFVRAYQGVNSRWYKSAVVQKAGIIKALGKEWAVRFEPADQTLNNQIDQAYRLKYANCSYLGSMISQRAKDATIEILIVSN